MNNKQRGRLGGVKRTAKVNRRTDKLQKARQDKDRQERARLKKAWTKYECLRSSEKSGTTSMSVSEPQRLTLGAQTGLQQFGAPSSSEHAQFDDKLPPLSRYMENLSAVKNLQNEIEMKVAEKSELCTRVTNLENDLSATQAQLDKNEEDRKVLTERVAKLEADLNATENLVPQMVQKYKTELSEARKTLELLKRKLIRRDSSVKRSPSVRKDWAVMHRSSKSDFVDKVYASLDGLPETAIEEIVQGLARKVNMVAVRKYSVHEVSALMNEMKLPYKKQRILRRSLAGHSPLNKTPFPSEHELREFLNFLSADHFRTSSKYVQMADELLPMVSVVDLKAVIKRRLEILAQAGNINFWEPNKIHICWVADHGNETNKIGFMVGSTKNKVASLENLTVVGIYKGSEKFTREMFAELAAKANDVKDIEFLTQNGLMRCQIEHFFVGDYKCQKEIFGLCGEGSGNFPCIFCTAKKEKQYGSGLNQIASLRDPMELDAFGRNKQSLFPSATFVIPFFHVFLGIGTKFINLLVQEAVKMDQNHLDENEIDQLMIRFKHAQKFLGKKSGQIELRSQLEEAEMQIQIHENLVNELTLEIFGTPRRREMDDDDENECGAQFCKSIEEMPIRLGADDWIECSACGTWYHTVCLGLAKKEVIKASKAHFSCYNCAKSTVVAEKILDTIQEELILWKRRHDELVSKQQSSSANADPIWNGSVLQKLEKNIMKTGATRKAYFADFNGNHLRIMLTKPEKLGVDLPRTAEFDKILVAVKLLGIVQQYTEARFFGDGELDACLRSIENLKKFLVQNFPHLSPAQKGHLLFVHGPEWAKNMNSLAVFTEQSIEAAHSDFKSQYRRLSHHDCCVNYSRILLWHYYRNLIYDSNST